MARERTVAVPDALELADLVASTDHRCRTVGRVDAELSGLLVTRETARSVGRARRAARAVAILDAACGARLVLADEAHGALARERAGALVLELTASARRSPGSDETSKARAAVARVDTLASAVTDDADERVRAVAVDLAALTDEKSGAAARERERHEDQPRKECSAGRHGHITLTGLKLSVMVPSPS